MFRTSLLFLLFLLFSAGCRHVVVEVDCRLTGDQSYHRYLRGPRYVIRGVDEQAEASLAFEEFSAMLSQELSFEYSNLKRVRPEGPADVVFTLAYGVSDRGAGVETYPVYGHYGYGWHWGPGLRRHGYYGVVGTEVQRVHLGYLHSLFVSAWVGDELQPAGRRVIWEGNCDLVSSNRSLKFSMPYLMAALGRYYSRATERPVRVKFDADDEFVRRLAIHAGPGTRPSD
ncbi:MAG: hypothetical protein ACYTF1_08090 [Planctomycetota bacterium]|jgi:hypothetical protein